MKTLHTLKSQVKKEFYNSYQGKDLYVLSLENINGVCLRVTNFGATIMSLEVPDALGGRTNVIVGFDSLDDYVEKSKDKKSMYLGASIGRYAGRISQEKISIGGTEYPLYAKDGVHLHGGKHGFDEQVWNIEKVDEEDLSITLSYLSYHLEEGYPGNLLVKVIYKLTDNNELVIRYEGVSDQDTVINLTNHAYFNLNGKNSILDHSLLIHSDSYLEVKENKIPSGTIQPVTDTKFDFLSSKSLDLIASQDAIDDTFVFNKNEDVQVVLKAPSTGISMEVSTNQPATVVFTPKRFPANWEFYQKATYTEFPAICFETQNFPDAPNNDHFPSTIVKAEELYVNESVFKFSW